MLKIKKPITIFFLVFIIVLLLSAKSDKRSEIIKAAKKYAGKPGIYDCSTLVRKILNQADIVFIEEGIKNSRSRHKKGVRIIYEILARKGKIYRDYRTAGLGDLVLFNNTYDMNRNRRLDDRFTHIGIITRIDRDGTMQYLHSTIGKGIIYGYLNLQHKSVYKRGDKVLNNYLRRKSRHDRPGTKYLSGELFFAFGKVL